MIKFIKMKKIFILLGLVVAVIGCTNSDIEFDDFEFQAVYFPFQAPVRSIMLGDEVIGDNSIDLEGAFSIGAAMGGAYENTSNREIDVELAPELVNNLADGNGNPLQLLPASYYDATFDKIVIPAGSFVGKMRVNLTDAFFNDPLSTELNYVLPVRMTAATGIDSILQGMPAASVVSPNPIISSDWAITPKNYVLFGVKYVNKTHGIYLYRGKRVDITDPSQPKDTVSYSTRFLDDNITIKLNTSSLSQSVTDKVAGGGAYEARRNQGYTMLLTFDEANNTVAVEQKDATTSPISGTGVYYSKDDDLAESYNGKKHRTIYLDYTFEDVRGKRFQVNDSLVFVDTDMKFEEFVPQVVAQP